MRDVFVSHARQDGAVALAIARGLAAAGYTTWCYEHDSDPGPSYLAQIDEELELTQAVVLVVSVQALESPQVVKEVVRAHEAGKPFIPLRVGIEHDAIQRHRDFRMALGASVSMALPDDHVEAILPRIIRGLERSGVRPGAVATPRPSQPIPVPPTPLPPPSAADLVRKAGDRATQVIDRTSDASRIAITTIIGTLGTIAAFTNLRNVLNARGEVAYFYQTIPAIKTANLWGNAAGLALNVILLYSIWQRYRGYAVNDRIRLLTSLMLITIVVWCLIVSWSAIFPPYGRLPVADRAAVVGTTLLVALLAALPAVLVRTFYRR